MPSSETAIMATRSRAAFPHIVRNPEIVGGEPIIKGTRIPVRSVVILYQLYNDMDRLGEAFPTATRVSLEEALDFYKVHQVEIDHYIEINEQGALSPGEHDF